MSEKSDLLVLGATGFTGGLITRYLSAHPQRSHFSLAIAARSPQKLEALVRNLSLPKSVKLVQVDVTNPDEVERAVKEARVVINTVGPYWLLGMPVIRSCVRNGVHYVDLCGETPFIKRIIHEFDYYATKTGSIVIPGCGFDSVPSDISAYLANKTLKSIKTSNAEYLNAGMSTSAQQFCGGISGGTIASALVSIEQVPRSVTKEAGRPYSLSPFIGVSPPPLRLLYNLAIPGSKSIKGAFFIMAPANQSLVQRTYGLLELQATKKIQEFQLQRYGPQFNYDEFLAQPNALSALVLTATLIIGFSMFMIKPIRNILKKFLPKPGEGPADEEMEKGFFSVTNMTSSTSCPPVQVKTVIKGKGDPGYLLTAIMISESALSILLPPVSESANIKATPGQSSNIHALTAMAQEGGLLTPMTALGDVLIKRLSETGRFEFSSSVVGGDKKTV